MGGGREIVGIVGIVGIALSSPKLATNRSCSWYLVNGHEGERERSVGVCSVGKNVKIIKIASGDMGRHRERVGIVGRVG